MNGGGWPAVNIVDVPPRASRLPIQIAQSDELGVRFPSYFGSEFGASVMSSFESLSATLAPEHWSLHGGAAADNCDAHDSTNSFWRDCTGGNVMSERNYPCGTSVTLMTHSLRFLKLFNIEDTDEVHRLP